MFFLSNLTPQDMNMLFFLDERYAIGINSHSALVRTQLLVDLAIKGTSVPTGYLAGNLNRLSRGVFPFLRLSRLVVGGLKCPS